MASERGRILVVEDDPLARAILTRRLQAEGHEAETAESGLQALDRLERADAAPFDVVLLDIEMPGLDGYETLSRIKENEGLRHIPVIMISGVDELASIVRCIEMGATDYLPKPFDAAILRARLNASLAEKRLRDLELEYLEQVGRVIAAAGAVEADDFDPAS